MYQRNNLKELLFTLSELLIMIQTLTDLGSLIHQRTNVPSKLMLIQVISIVKFFRFYLLFSIGISSSISKQVLSHKKGLYLKLDKMSSEFLSVRADDSESIQELQLQFFQKIRCLCDAYFYFIVSSYKLFCI